ncbi:MULTISPECIES: hypothetical protein [Paenibacillus]|jgi:hypothetical protein|uniref:Uncharacterized protein n=1 Tax=Paenibacillus oceani TaxID=2772510 RepID=A0A927CGG9_9BACL|nr:hypothetical protein [Paenibacillus oceani]MBD2866532.1 hypothetical protein [Paenibacillus oceani]MDF2662268.1 hypothetical protein [Paenibacillus sp.]
MPRKRVYSDEERRKRHCEASRKYREANLEKVSAYNKKWKAENWEYYSEYNREYLRRWRQRKKMGNTTTTT